MYQLLVSAAEAKKIFHDKLFNRYLTVKKAYRALDMEGTGRVSYASVREMLAEMGANMNDEQFAMFIKDLDPACKDSAAVCGGLDCSLSLFVWLALPSVSLQALAMSPTSTLTTLWALSSSLARMALASCSHDPPLLC